MCVHVSRRERVQSSHMTVGGALVCALGVCLLGVATAKAPVPEAQAALRDVRVSMCHAVIRELHIEIHKHSLRKNGEDDIYETVPAICLAIVQNYTLSVTARPQTTWSLTKRSTKLDDEIEPSHDDLRHLLTLKKTCEAFTDDLQQELSELMYGAAMQREADEIVADFCAKPAVVKPAKPPPSAKRRAEPTDAEAGGKGGGGKGGDSKGDEDKGGSKGSGKKANKKADKKADKKGGKKGKKGAAPTGRPDMDALLRKCARPSLSLPSRGVACLALILTD